MISFRPFRMWFAAENRRRMELINDVGLNPRTAKKVWEDGNTTLETVDKICEYYNLPVHQVIEFIPNKKKH